MYVYKICICVCSHAYINSDSSFGVVTNDYNPFYVIEQSYLIHRLNPHRYYHSESEWTWEL